MALGGLVLSGGEGRRMGYQNKGLMPLGNNIDLIDPVLRLLREQCQYVAISANQDIAVYQQKKLDVWTDVKPWVNCGPLGGVYSSVLQFPPEIDVIQVVPCDSPFIDQHVIQRLSAQRIQQNHLAVYAATKSQIYPVIFQFKREAMSHLQHYLQTELKHSIRKWLAQIHAEAVMFDDDSPFTNINDVTTLQRYSREGIYP